MHTWVTAIRPFTLRLRYRALSSLALVWVSAQRKGLPEAKS